MAKDEACLSNRVVRDDTIGGCASGARLATGLRHAINWRAILGLNRIELLIDYRPADNSRLFGIMS